MKEVSAQLARKLLDLILPPRESLKNIRGLTPAELEGYALPREAEFGEALLDYRKKIVRDLLWEFKFYRNREALVLLSEVLRDHLMAELGDELLPDRDRKALLISIPSSKTRMRDRGYEPLKSLIKHIVKTDNGGVLEDGSDALSKVIETRRQTQIKNREERLRNVAGAFRARKSEALRGKTIFVIDDITTTGATFREATRALEEAGARDINCIALAH